MTLNMEEIFEKADSSPILIDDSYESEETDSISIPSNSEISEMMDYTQEQVNKKAKVEKSTRSRNEILGEARNRISTKSREYLDYFDARKEPRFFLYKRLNEREYQIDEAHEKIRKNPKGDWEI